MRSPHLLDNTVCVHAFRALRTRVVALLRCVYLYVPLCISHPHTFCDTHCSHGSVVPFAVTVMHVHPTYVHYSFLICCLLHRSVHSMYVYVWVSLLVITAYRCSGLCLPDTFISYRFWILQFSTSRWIFVLCRWVELDCTCYMHYFAVYVCCLHLLTVLLRHD